MKRRWTNWVLGGLLLLAAAGAARAAGGGEPVFIPEEQATLKSGRMALEDGFPERAERVFEFYIRKSTNLAERAEGSLWLGRAMIAQGKHQQAAEMLGNCQRWVQSPELVAGIGYWLGRAYFEQGNFAAAAHALESSRGPQPSRAYGLPADRLRALCYRRAQKPERALALYAEMDQTYADAAGLADVRLEWAGLLVELGRAAEACGPLRRLLERQPQAPAAPAARLTLGRLLLQLNQTAEAEGLLRGLGADGQADAALRAEAWQLLAAAWERQAQPEAAAMALGQLAQVTRQPAVKLQAELARGKLLIKMGKVEEGVGLLRASVRARPADPAAGQLQLELAQVLLDHQLQARAAEEFQNYLEAFADPAGQLRALTGQGWAFWELGRYAEAAAAFEKVVRQQPDPAARQEALCKAADCYFANRQYQMALAAYQRLGQAQPPPALADQARFQSAECQIQLGELAAAAATLRQLAGAPATAALGEKAWMRLAQVEERQGQWDAARTVYERVMTNSPSAEGRCRALHGRGLIRYRQGQFKEARGDFEQVVRDCPQGEVAEQSFYMRGWALYLLGQDEAALQVCRQFLERYPRSAWAADVWFWLGEYSFNHGQYGEAERQFAALPERYPQAALTDDALYWAGRAAAAGKEYLRALEHFNRLAKSHPASARLPETRFAQGDTLCDLGQFAGAILAYEEIIKKYPASAWVDLAWGRKGDCQFTLGAEAPERYAEALESYRMVLQSAAATPELKWQAEYKMGRCREKMRLPGDALEHYMNIIYGYLAARERGATPEALWFTRAAFDAAAVRETTGQWREAIRLYQRVVQAGVPAAAEAQERAARLQQAHAP